ncbi:hypothetical protein NUW54_g10511 [Trametes sanguinea]|uniref:Uncharacterized protein n=1 Tax=Trametes sanguinea TaxID=158606 RepID=A0ACC1NYR0_9APHY|nr:hypothetical protein NUW54_g10511 [Trametes sanguinea]
MDSAIPPVQPLKEDLLGQLIGFTFATTLYGVSLIQGYMYYRKYERDSIRLKALVAAMLILDTLTSATMAHAWYSYVVLDFGKPFRLLRIVWSYAVCVYWLRLALCTDTCPTNGISWRTRFQSARPSLSNGRSHPSYVWNLGVTNTPPSFYAHLIWSFDHKNKKIVALIYALATTNLGEFMHKDLLGKFLIIDSHRGWIRCGSADRLPDMYAEHTSRPY